MASAYSASKAAVIGLTKSIAKEVAGTGVLVNCIAPAVIDTPILGQLSEEHIGYMVEKIPLGRVGTARGGRASDRLSRERGSELRDRGLLRHLRRTGGLLMRIVRFRAAGEEPHFGVVLPSAPTTVSELEEDDVLAVMRGEHSLTGRTIEAVDAETLQLPPPFELLVPLEPPETWAAGVTYERSRDARVDESRVEARDVYGLVYDAERPELFLKDAVGRRTVGPGGTVGVRSDAAWTVPEPELALVLDDEGELLGATIGNDVTARDVEGANPLYLPQAKLFAGACALGPAVLVPTDWSEPFEIEIRITGPDGAEVVFEGRTSTARMRRSFEELAAWLVRDNPLPAGSVLLTGTGLVPPDDVALTPGQQVEIRIPGIGKLVNPVGAAADLLTGERSKTHVR